MLKKFFSIAVLAVVALPASGAYEEVSCAVDAVYSQYACSQCFNGWDVNVWANLSFLDDLWKNDGGLDKLAFKLEQSYPIMYPLNGSQVTQNPSNDSLFWEYTPAFESLYDSQFDGYVLPAGQNVSWIKSADGASYLVESVPAKGQNAWLLVFDIISNDILDNGSLSNNNVPHRECVLYKSWDTYTPPAPPVTPPTPGEMTQVPTGPEMYFAILLFALLMAIVVMNRQAILEKIKK